MEKSSFFSYQQSKGRTLFLEFLVENDHCSIILLLQINVPNFVPQNAYSQ